MTSSFLKGGFIGTGTTFDSTDKHIAGYVDGYMLPEVVSSISFSGGGTGSSIVLDISSMQMQEGDLIVAFLAIASTSSISYRITDYTQLSNIYAGDAIDTVLQSGYKIVGTTPESTITISGGTGSIDNAYTVAVTIIRNVDVTTILDVPVRTSNGGGSAVPNPPSITPVTYNSLLLVAGAAGHYTTGDLIYSVPNTLKTISASANDTNDISFLVNVSRWTGGTYAPPPMVFTGGTSNEGDYSNCGLTIALRPKYGKVPIYGNHKNSGIWDIRSVIAVKTAPILYVGSSIALDPRSSAINLRYPTGTQIGDFAVMIVAADPQGILTSQTGWTALTDSNGYAGVFYKTVDSINSFNVATSGGGNMSATLAVFRNVIGLKQHAVYRGSILSNQINPPALSDTDPKNACVVLSGRTGGAVTQVAPAGFTLANQQFYPFSSATAISYKNKIEATSIDPGVTNGSSYSFVFAWTLELEGY